MATRWGIVSAGKICHDFLTAMASLPAGEHTVIAVAARDLSRARDLAKVHNAQKAYGSYEDLANDRDVEVVYIGTLNPYHLDVTKLMLNHGKHVLCEKALTMNLKQTTELIDLAKKKGLFLMEAIWSRCSPIYDWVKEEIESGSLGDIKQVIVTLGLPMTTDENRRKMNQEGGTILDLGVYVLQFASFVFNGEKPISVSASGHLNEEGIDVATTVSLLYKNQRSATILTHSLVKLPNDGIIVGTKGTLEVPNFWCPVQFIKSSGQTRTMTLPESAVPYNNMNSAALRFEAEEVRKCLLAGLKESSRVTHQDSLLIAELQDEVRRQIGVVYPEDEQSV